MLRAVTVDDELPNHLLLMRFIEAEGQMNVVGQFTDPLSFLAEAADLNPDVAFIDIEMPVMSGLELAEQLVTLCPDVEVVFVTAFSQYAIEAFHVNALDYLLKPVDFQEMKRVSEKLQKIVLMKEHPPAEASPERENPGKILCLGEFEVYGTASERKVQWLTVKVEELLAYLLMYAEKSVSKESLCEVLWPDSDYENALMNLYSTVCRLRKTIRNAGVPVQIKSDKDGYRLEAGDCFIDYQAFEDLAGDLKKDGSDPGTDQDVDGLVEAGRLYRGELFGARSYQWSASRSEEINRHYRQLCYSLAGYYTRENRLEQGAEQLNKLLESFPDEEEACMQLMTILARQKDQAAVERLYQRYTTYLETEMNVAPTLQFQKHYASLSSGE